MAVVALEVRTRAIAVCRTRILFRPGLLPGSRPTVAAGTSRIGSKSKSKSKSSPDSHSLTWFTAQLEPLHVEFAGHVDPLERVGAEVVALCLEQIGGQHATAVAVIVR